MFAIVLGITFLYGRQVVWNEQELLSILETNVPCRDTKESPSRGHTCEA